MEVKHRNSTDVRASMVKDIDTGTSARQANSHRLHREPHAHGPEKLLKPPVGLTQSECALRRRA
jgi:hypothetical protein